ncbi:unnamed protein product [Caenorhabditis brenneri]
MAYSYVDVDLFPSRGDTKCIYQIYRFIEKLSVDSIYAEFYISMVGVCLTIFHLIILLKVLGSSIVSIMIATAICDLLSMIVNIASRGMILNMQGGICTPPNTLFVNQIFWILMSIRDNVIRCSTWLAVLMAVIRFLVSKYFSTSQFHSIASLKFGFQASTVGILLSSLMSISYFLCVNFGVVGIWRPAVNCTNVPLNMEAPMYEQRISELFSMSDGMPFKVFMLVNGFLSKVILRNLTEKTTILVITMTSSLFIASLPTGIATVFQVAYSDLGFLFLFIYVDTICNALLLSNASINCFICSAMSSQYRKTVKKVLRISRAVHVNSTGVSLRRTTN